MSALTIRTHNLDVFQDRLSTLNKRFVKHGLAPATIVATQAKLQTRPQSYWSAATTRVVDLDPTGDPKGALAQIIQSMQERVQDVVYAVEVGVPAELIVWHGHRVCGRIQRQEGGDIITVIGDQGVDLGVYRDQPFVCSHCHTRRSRKSLWVFLREADGQLVTLGDDCAEEYFGVDVQTLLEDAQSLYSAAEEGEEWGYGGGNRLDTPRAFLLASFGASLIAFEGYKSRKVHEDQCTAAQASGLAAWVMQKGFEQVSVSLGDAWNRFTREWWDRTAPRWQEFCQIAQDARAWWEAQTPTENYLANCKAAMTTMNPHLAGFIVAGTWEYMKAQGMVGSGAKRDAYADGWFGQPATKVKDVPVELVDIRAYEGDYGVRYYVSFRDAEGHYLLWKTSSDPNSTGGWKQGTRLLLAGTIKTHDTKGSLKRTILLRCKLVALDPPAAGETAA